VSSHGRRGLRSPQTGEDGRYDEADPGRFFGETGRSRRGTWKTLQLCKQVERAAAVVLAGECESDVLLGASVAAVEPAPDASRLRVTIVLVPAGDRAAPLAEALAALRRVTVRFREEIARCIHRKRVPEIVFDVRFDEEASRE
jgi:ribosome-binding factor A